MSKDEAAKPRVYVVGEQLALDIARLFPHPSHPKFHVVTRRVEVIEDDGWNVSIRPVAEKDGAAIDGAAKAYSIGREQKPFPIIGRWRDGYAPTWCPSCKGTGRREPWIPPPMRPKDMLALSKVLEPWCPKACPHRKDWRGAECLNVPREEHGRWEWIDLKLCACGRLRRNSGAVYLRESHRAPLALVGVKDEDTDQQPEPLPGLGGGKE